MRIFLLFVLLLLVSLFLGALANYPLYMLLQDITNPRPERLINVAAKLIAIPGFILIIRHYAIYSKQGLGYGLPRTEFIREILRGLASGLSILSVIAVVLLVLGIRVSKIPVDGMAFLIAKTAIAAIIGALLTGFIEETFFRGGLFGAIRKQDGFITAMLLSALFYALLHFIKQPELPTGETYEWYSGLQILSGALQIYAIKFSTDSFLSLFVLGVLFAVIRERTGNIAYCIGLHAGFVFVVKLLRKLTKVDDANSLSVLVSSYDGVTGYFSAAVLLICTLYVYRYWGKLQPVKPIKAALGERVAQNR